MTTDIHSPIYTSETAGAVVHVTGAAKGKLAVSGLIYMALALLLLVSGPMLADNEKKLKDPDMMLMKVVPITLAGAFFAATATRRFLAVGDRRIYLRAGPDGMVIGMPSRKLRDIFRLEYRFEVHQIAWKDIRTWFLHIERVKGIPIYISLVFDGLKGDTLKAPLIFFAGSKRQLTDDINRAINRIDLRNTVPLAPVQSQGTQPENCHELCGPMMTTLDISSHPEEKRMESTRILADRLEAFLKTRFGVEHGYSCKSDYHRPFEERPYLRGYEVILQKGLLWGCKIRMAPADFQALKIHISLVSKPRLDEVIVMAVIFIAILAGIVGALMGGEFTTTTHNDWLQMDSPFWGFIISFVVAGGTLFCIFKLFSKLLINILTNTDRTEHEQQALWLELLAVFKHY